MIYLKPSTSPLAYQDTFTLPETTHRFNVIRMWEQPTEILQQYLGLMPLAVLSKTDDPAETLKQVAKQIEAIPDQRLQSNVAASTYLISGLVLSREIIQRLLRSEIMKESVTYQALLDEGRSEGIALGIAEGKAEGKAEGIAIERQQIALNMLRLRLEINLIAQITGLTVEEITNFTQV